MTDCDAAREGLVQVMRRMHATGLNRGTSGNASIRVDGGMMVTPSGVPPDALTAEGMVFVAEDGTPGDAPRLLAARREFLAGAVESGWTPAQGAEALGITLAQAAAILAAPPPRTNR